MASSTLIVVGLLALFAGGSALNVAKTRPVAKVINLLKEMNSNLEKEAEDDEATYDKMACWCETNEKAKTKSVADGRQRDEQLTALIPELAAKSAQLKVEIAQLTKEIGHNQEALSESTELRAKELGAFREEEKDGIASISGLRNAVGALSKPHAALTQAVMLQIQQSMTHRSEDALRKFLSVSQRKTVLSLLHKKAPHLEEYAPQSGEIFGILKGMKESFEQNLANAQKEEAESVATFFEVKKAKEHEISAATQQVADKQVELGNTDEKNAGSKEDLEDTRAAVTADSAFLLDLQERCGSMDKEYADRQKIRAQEMAAVSEALKILTDDDAHDLFEKSTGSSFVQLKTTRSSLSRRQQVLAILKSASSPQLSMLALTLKDDVFAKIKEVLEDLTKKLEAEQQDDVAQRDVCIEDLNTNEKELAAKHSLKDDAATRIEELTLAVEKLDEEVAAAQAEIEETKKEMLVASENREKENHDFQLTVQDQRATQQIITKALDRLKAFYGDAAFMQVRGTSAAHAAIGQAPPPGFGGEYKKSEGASSVTGMMQQVIDESKQVEEEAVNAEREAQSAYVQFQKDANDSVDSLNNSIADKKAAAGKADSEKILTEEDLKSLTGDIKGLKLFGGQLHSQCDFLLKNFEVRQASRTQEIEALAEAKAVMSGAEA